MLLWAYACGVRVVLGCAVVHLHYGNAEVHSQSVHIEEPQEAEYGQRVSGRHPGEEVHAAQPLEGKLVPPSLIRVHTDHLFLWIRYAFLHSSSLATNSLA